MSVSPAKLSFRDVLLKLFTCKNIKSQCCEKQVTITNNDNHITITVMPEQIKDIRHEIKNQLQAVGRSLPEQHRDSILPELQTISETVTLKVCEHYLQTEGVECKKNID
jgi:hypothetical protein